MNNLSVNCQVDNRCHTKSFLSILFPNIDAGRYILYDSYDYIVRNLGFLSVDCPPSFGNLSFPFLISFSSLSSLAFLLSLSYLLSFPLFLLFLFLLSTAVFSFPSVYLFTSIFFFSVVSSVLTGL